MARISIYTMLFKIKRNILVINTQPCILQWSLRLGDTKYNRFLPKSEVFKRILDILWNAMMANLQNLSPFFHNELFSTWRIWKVCTNNKNCTFRKTTEFFWGHVCTEIFQNQVLKVKIWHFLKPCHHSILKYNEDSFEHLG